MTIAEILTKARKQIDKPEKWWQSGDKKAVTPEVKRYCIVIALGNNREWWGDAKLAHDTNDFLTGVFQMDPIEWNDTRESHEQMLAELDAAIAVAKEIGI